ncbi:diguanylate cyclase [Oceanispirochaeta crateris]|nr:diguanylate cyclase [Oceanispirochaeta crateris]
MTYVKYKSSSLFFLLLFFCLSFTGCGNVENSEDKIPQAALGVLDLRDWNFQGKGLIPLEGEWAFVWEQLLSPQKMRASDAAHYAFVPDKWYNYFIDGENPDSQGFATFSLTLILPGKEQYYGFSFDGVGSAYTLWMNGQLLLKSGTVGTSKEQMVPNKIPQSAFFKSSGEPLELVLHISNFHHKKGGFRNSLYVGLPNQIQSFQRNAWTLEAFTLGILFIMGLYHLSVFVFRKKFRSALYFALLCFAFFMRLGITNQDLLLLAFPFVSWTLAFYLDYITLFFIPPLVALFYRSLYPEDIPRVFLHIFCALSGLFSLYIILAGTYLASFSIQYYQVLILLEIGYYLYFLIRINYKKREGAMVITIASIILFITSSIEILSLWDWLGADKIGVYGFLSFILVQSILLSLRYSQSFARVESLTKALKSTNRYLQESEIRYRNFFENSIDILFLTDEESRIIDVSPSSEKMLGFSRADVLHRKVTDLFSSVVYDTLYEELCQSGEPVRNSEVVLRHRDGHKIEALVTLALRFDDQGNPAGLQGSVHDNTDKKRADREKMRILELEQIALTDPLTKAYNRRFFSEVAKKELTRAQRKGSSFSLVILDIDFFKNVNDQYGHLIGDEVLINLTHLCHEYIRSTDILARFGGEEFVILFPDSPGIETLKRVELLRENVSRSVIAHKDGEEIRISISLGISSWNPGQESNLKELLDQADQALYQAKESGRNKALLFGEDLLSDLS